LAEFLAELGPAAPRHPLSVTAAYHDACHLAHAQRITRQPRDLLRAIPGLTLVEVPDAARTSRSRTPRRSWTPRSAAARSSTSRPPACRTPAGRLPDARRTR